jgi:hypothetical protein
VSSTAPDPVPADDTSAFPFLSGTTHDFIGIFQHAVNAGLKIDDK